VAVTSQQKLCGITSPWALALGLITFLPAAAVTLYLLWPVAGPASPPPGFPPAMLLVGLLYVAGVVTGLRLMLLPARAIGNSSLSFSQAWNRTRGNIWRLFWGLWFTTVAFLIVVGLPRPSATIDDDFVMRMSALSTIVMICYLLLVPIGIGFLSLSPTGISSSRRLNSRNRPRQKGMTSDEIAPLVDRDGAWHVPE
jgi:hypothetical protein